MELEIHPGLRQPLSISATPRFLLGRLRALRESLDKAGPINLLSLWRHDLPVELAYDGRSQLRGDGTFLSMIHNKSPYLGAGRIKARHSFYHILHRNGFLRSALELLAFGTLCAVILAWQWVMT
jgi:hypothetical protein